MPESPETPIRVVLKPGESPSPPEWDYDAWGEDGDGNIYHLMYGGWWPKAGNYTMTDIELECFRTARGPEKGGIGKYGHLRNAVDGLWNSGAKKCVEWNPWLEKMLEEACDNEYLGVAGASSTSKSFGGAILAWVHVLSAPEDSLALVTSTSIAAAKKRIWKSCVELYNNLPGKYRKMYKHSISKNMFHWVGWGNGMIVPDSCSLHLIASEPKQEATAVQKLIGLKAKRVLMVADELCELSHAIVAAADNLMSNPEYRMVAMSNPKDREDPFGLFMEPVDGWNSIDESSYEWTTKMGKAIRFDVLQSPNYLERENIYKYMLTYEKVERMRHQHGDTSARFYRFFRGFFPIVGQEDVLYSETDFRAYLKDTVEWKDKPVKVAALDPASSSGGDRNILTICLYGMDKSGIPCLQFDSFRHLKENAADKMTPFNEQMVKQTKAILEMEGILPGNFAVDNTGAKAFGEWLVKEVGRDIVRVEFGGAASERPVTATDQTASKKRFYNRVSELWGVGIEFLRGGQIAGLRNCPDLVGELKSRHYDMVKGGDGERLRVEPKREMKQRTGKSPDLADSFLLTIELCRQRFSFASHERGMQNIPAEDDYLALMRSLDIVTRSSGGMPDWMPLAS